MTSVTEQTLQETMSKLETALLAPVISGELLTWVRNVEQAAATFALDFAAYVRTVLHVQYSEIAKNDTELLPYVEKLIKTDQQLLQDLAQFHEELHALRDRAAQVEKHESKVAERREQVEEAGLSLILRIKRQQAAAGTWLSEALYRDRGVAAD